jgi:hypothetical protein
MSQQAPNIECPICYDDMDQEKNCVTTECGHRFHCSCLMKNAANNGFACPMCRNIMAEEPDCEYDDEEEDWNEEDDEDGWSDDTFPTFQRITDNSLTSFRMFHQQIDGEEIEEEPEIPIPEEEIEEVEMAKPSPEFIAAKLIAQGFTLTDFVKSMLTEHEEYDNEHRENNAVSNQLFGAFRILISNYSRVSQPDIERYEKAAETQVRIASSVIHAETTPQDSGPVLEKILILDGMIIDGRKTAERYFGNAAQRYIDNNDNKF